MSDFAHWFGNDLQLSASGDFLLSDGLDQSNERIVRRLMTNEGAYVWHFDYGASIPLRVGGLNGSLPGEDALGLLSVDAVVRTQMFLEASVQQDPEPNLSIEPITSGVSVTVQYIDALSGENASLDFDVVI